MLTVGQVKNTIDAVRSAAKSFIPAVSRTSATKPVAALPEFLYHLTPKSTLEKILSSGKITFSSFEKEAGALSGVYMVDKSNFFNKYFGESLLGLDLGKALILYTAKTDKSLSAIRIPTSKLNPEFLRFRPYKTMCEEVFNSTKSVKNIDICKRGLPLSELSEYIVREPIEYAYTREIPVSCFDNIKTAQVLDKVMDINSVDKEQVLSLFA